MACAALLRYRRPMREMMLGTLLAVSLAACDDGDGAPADAEVPEQDGGDGGGAEDAGEKDAGVDAAACHTAGDAGPPPEQDAGAPAAAPSAGCGAPSFPEGTGLRRHPYLQSVTRTSARVAWTSRTGGAGVVRIASSPDGPWTDFEATAEEFTTARTGDTEDYVAYDATLEGLEPNEAYCYEVLEDGEVLATGLELHTAWDGDARPVRILAFGDSGNASPEQRAVRDAFMEREHDVFLHLGDMAYGDGTFVEFEERVFGIYRDFMHRVPSFPTIGNHEYKTDGGQPYLDVYYLFEQALREQDQERYYSFDYGNVHFVSLDSNGEMLIPIALDTAGRIEDDMLDWLADDLASSDADWKVAFFHHPPYSSSDRGLNDAVINHLVPLLEAGGVDLVLVGHDHHYERTVPLKGGCAAPADRGAITYIIAGGGGAGIRDAAGDWFTASFDDEVNSFLTLEIHGCKATGETVDLRGETIDRFTLWGCE